MSWTGRKVDYDGRRWLIIDEYEDGELLLEVVGGTERANVGRNHVTVIRLEKP